MATYNFVVDGRFVNISGVANTHSRLHNSSQAIEWFYDGSGDLVFSIDDAPYLVKDMSDVIIDGVTLTDPSEFETNIKLIFPGYAGGGAGFPAGTKMYTALLSQSGTDAPVATVLQNTLGGTVVWARSLAGIYLGTLTGVFLAAKTFIPQVGLFNAGPGDGAPSTPAYINIFRSSDNAVMVQTSDGGDFLDYSTLLVSPPPIPIQILIFP